MDTIRFLVLNVMIYFLFGCANSKKPAQIENNSDSINIISAQMSDYFPGTGIGRGEHFTIIAINNSSSTVKFDSLQTKLHCLKFDGQPIIQGNDTLTINAYGLSIDYDLFPDIPKQQVKGDSSLVNGGIIYYTQGNKNKTMVIESFEKMASKFYE
jgi:hypothetical protein